jgi:hypothetical protein
MVLFSCSFLSAQDILQHEWVVRTHGLSIHFLGAPVWPVGIAYSQMLNDRMVLHIGAGALSSGLVFEYYVTNPRKQRFNVTTALYGSMNYEGFLMGYAH